MTRTNWIVIEGDNGAGKDSLADLLSKKCGWEILTRHAEAERLKCAAAALTGSGRIAAYMELNQWCADRACHGPRPGVLVRYWPSTMAAAFADQLLNWTDVENRVRVAIDELPKPTHYFYLECDFATRAARIRSRASSISADSLCAARDQRYRKAVAGISAIVGESAWTNIYTGPMSKELVYDSVTAALRSRGIL